MDYFLNNYIEKKYDENYCEISVYDKKEERNFIYLALNPPENLVEEAYNSWGNLDSAISFGIKNEIILRKYLAKKASITFLPRMLVKIDKDWKFYELDGIMVFNENFECNFLKEIYPQRLIEKEELVTFKAKDLVFLEVKGSLYYNSFELMKLSEQQEEEPDENETEVLVEEKKENKIDYQKTKEKIIDNIRGVLMSFQQKIYLSFYDAIDTLSCTNTKIDLKNCKYVLFTNNVPHDIMIDALQECIQRQEFKKLSWFIDNLTVYWYSSNGVSNLLMNLVEEKATKFEEKATNFEEKATKFEEKATKFEEKATKLEEKVTKIEEKTTKLEEQVSKGIRCIIQLHLRLNHSLPTIYQNVIEYGFEITEMKVKEIMEEDILKNKK